LTYATIKKVVYITFGLVLYGLQADAQRRVPSHPKAAKAYQVAMTNLNLHAYPAAVQALQEVLRYDSTFVVGRQQLADIYLRMQDYTNASAQYKQVTIQAPSLTPSTWFGLGESLLYTGNYAEAKRAFTEYLQRATPTSKNRTLAKKHIIDCEFSIQELIRQHVDTFAIANMGENINSENDEYFPMLTIDRSAIIFTRQAKGDLEHIYFSKHHKNTWAPAALLPREINAANYSEGAHCISADGKYLFFTGCNYPQGKGSCDIYVSRREGEHWSSPFNLGAPINTTGWEAQPAISPDGNTLYFVSNRKGGYGGSDIWYSTVQQDGSWSAPKNMGTKVNTSYNESTPFIHADNETLYFASDGWPGFGNKDIFVSKIDSSGNRLAPVNLGYPINDFAEQRAFSVSSDGKTAYFSAKRQDSYGGLDIYTVPLTAAVGPHPVGFIRARIFNSQTGQPLAAEVAVIKLSNQQIIYHANADYDDGTFLAPLPLGNDYALQVNHPAYLFYTHYFNMSKTTDRYTYQLEIPLSPILIGNSSILNNLFFPINGFELLPESKADLIALENFMKNNPSVKIEIAGHTDNTGNKQDNQILSEKRAYAVYDFLIKSGIAPQRLTYKGYGQSKPIADNNTPEGKQKNRRTDFRIIAIN